MNWPSLKVVSKIGSKDELTEPIDSFVRTVSGMLSLRPAVSVLISMYACTAQALPAQDMQAQIRAVETGLGPAVTITNRPAEHRNLLTEMQRLHIPAVSIAVIHDG